MRYCPSYRIADGTYGRPFFFFQSTWVLVTSPVPPAFSANALFFAAAMSFMLASHSARVILPSLFVSLLSKNPLSMVFSEPALVRCPSFSSPACFRMSSNDGILKSLSAASPGDQPAKNRVPPAATGVVQHADGIPATDHISSPV